MLVFLYGRSLSPDVLAGPCPEAVPWGRSLLRGFRMAEELEPNLRPDANGRIWGALVEVSDDELAALDRFEDARGYERVEVSVMIDECELSAWAYRNGSPTPGPLRIEAFSEMIEGALLNDLPETYLSEIEVLTVIDGRKTGPDDTVPER